ncbi:MAG: AlkZ family DNA glycosylase [Spirochaetales bacterium]|nr:AlkZ family DNA glycosylase [Spirochaetales bacterium]
MPGRKLEAIWAISWHRRAGAATLQYVDLSARSIASWRLAAQRLQNTEGCTVEQVVAWLGGIQAQDYSGAKWSIGIRLPRIVEREVERAIADRRILRTWAYRGTLHFLAAADAAWILALLAPTVIAANRRRYGQLQLDETTFSRSNRLIRSALEKSGHPLARSEICELLEDGGVSAQGQRAPYLLQRAALEGLICLGPKRGRESTYESAENLTNAGSSPRPDEAAAALAERYFSSHGPATIQDFCWWSGLPAATAREALRNASSLQPIAVEDRELWAGSDPPPGVQESAHLLPPFDDYLLGYRDRSLALDPAYSKRVNAGGGMMKPVFLVNGRAVGTWTQRNKPNGQMIWIQPFHDLSDRDYPAVTLATQAYAHFLETTVELQA